MMIKHKMNHKIKVLLCQLIYLIKYQLFINLLLLQHNHQFMDRVSLMDFHHHTLITIIIMMAITTTKVDIIVNMDI